MMIVSNIKNDLESIKHHPKKELTSLLWGTVTANADTISKVLNSDEYDRSSLERKILHYAGTGNSMVSQSADIALLRKNLVKKFYTDSKTIEIIFDRVMPLITEDLINGGEIEMFSTLRTSLSYIMHEELLGINFTEEDALIFKQMFTENKTGRLTNDSVYLLAILNILPLPNAMKQWFTKDTKKVNTVINTKVNFIYDKAIPRKNSLLSILKNAVDNGSLTKEEALGEMRVDFPVDTLTLSILWCFYMLSKNPSHKEKIKNDEEYARSAYMETLRMLPPVYIFSREQKTSKCPFHAVLPKKRVLISIAAVHKMEEYWSDPEEFKPERFSKGMTCIKKGSFIPFGMGHRACPGSSIALKIAPKIIQKLLQNFDIVLSKEPVIKRRIELTTYDNKMFFNVGRI